MNKKLKITCFILTFNEEKHIARCINSVRMVVDRVVVIDSLSTDRTVVIAEELGAKVLQNAWPGYARQINWALAMISEDSDWLFRLDADEVLVPAAQAALRHSIGRQPSAVDGLTVRRQLRFLGQDIRHGGLRGVQILRIFRSGKGRSEQRLMDEHIRVEGKIAKSGLTVVDENLNSINWMLEKYNSYSSLEAAETLNRRYGFLDRADVEPASLAQSVRIKRAIKHHIYLKLPPGLRVLAYFFFRYVVQLGFLDGKIGLTYHLMQALVYRTMVDAKILHAEKFLKENPSPDAFHRYVATCLDVDLRHFTREQWEAQNE